jgi:hypothetical protein
VPQSMSNITNALKDDYSPGLRNALNNMNVLWGEVSRNTEDIVGQQAHWSVQSGRSNSTGARAELAALPSADRQRYLKALDSLKFMYHTIKVSGPAKALTRNSDGAFVKAVESEVKGAERDIKLDMNRQSVGQKVTVNSALVSGGIATVSSKSGAVATFANEPSSVIRHFFVGMQVGFVIAASGAYRTGIYEVSSVSTSAKTVTFTQSLDAAVASTDVAVRVNGTTNNAGTVVQTNLDQEINGLRFLIGTQDYAGITAASNPVWNSLTLGSSTTAISEVILDQAVELVETDGSGDTPSMYLTEHAQRRKLASLLQAQKRYDGRELTLTSGWKGLEVARGALVVDRFVPSNLVFCLTPREIELFVGLDFQWDEDDADGTIFYKALDGSDAIEARYKWYGNLEAPTRNCHSVVTLAEPTF